MSLWWQLLFLSKYSLTFFNQGGTLEMLCNIIHYRVTLTLGVHNNCIVVSLSERETSLHDNPGILLKITAHYFKIRNFIYFHTGDKWW